MNILSLKTDALCVCVWQELQAFAELYCRKIEVYDASQPGE